MVSNNKGSSRKKTGAKPARRSSKGPRKPVTIDLEPTKVSSDLKDNKSDNASKSAHSKPEVNPAAEKKATSAVPSVKSAAKPSSASMPDPAKEPQPAKPGEKAADNGIKTEAAKSPAASMKPTSSKPDSKPASMNAPKPNKEGKSGGSLFNTIAAGVVGGAIALLGAYLFQQTGIVPASNNEDSALATKVGQIDQELSALGKKLETAGSPDTAPLIVRTSELEASQKSVIAKIAELTDQGLATKKLIDQLDVAIEGISAKTESLQQSISSGSAGENAGLAALDERLKALESGNAGAVDANNEDLATLKARLAELGAKLESFSAKNTDQSESVLAEASAKIADLSAKIQSFEQSTTELTAETDKKISGVNNELGTFADNLAGFGSRLETLEKNAESPQKDEQRVARAFAVAGLKSAIDAGGSFESALALVESLGADNEAVAALRPYAASGLPSISVLERSFSPLSDELIRLATPVEENGAMGKLFSNIRSLVKVRSTGVEKGDSPIAVVSRIRDGLKKSDLERVLAELDSLPEAAKQASSEWRKNVEARHSANSLIEKMLKQFTTGATGTEN